MKPYVLVPIVLVILAVVSSSSGTVTGFIIGTVLTLWAGIEWNAFWKYRRNQGG